MKALKIIRNWFVFLALLAVVIAPFWLWRPIGWQLPELPAMTGYQAIAFGFASAFVWVEVLKWGKRKPFNCLKCMCGWLTVIIAFAFNVEFWAFYLPLGLAVGAIFDAIRMRYL